MVTPTEEIPSDVDFHYKKDSVLKEALSYIISVRYEGQKLNGDFLNYWTLFHDNIVNISTASFRTGVRNFYSALKSNKNAHELMGYHFRLMVTLINNNAVMTAAETLFGVFAHSLRHEIDDDVAFDLNAGDDRLHQLTGFEQVLLLMHIYQDRIDCALAEIMLADKSYKGKR